MSVAPALSAEVPRIVGGSDLDVAAHAALQQRVFGPILEENAIPRARLGPRVFAWKLAPPAGPARIAVVERAGDLLSSCTAFPVALAAGQQHARGWHVCDAVTAPEARGQGLFGRVLATLCADLPARDWAFAFPNAQSRRAFAQAGFVTAAEVPLWFRPVMGHARPGLGVVPVTDFGAEHDELAQRLSAHGGLTALRSSAYLTWRYLRHPYFRYQCYEQRRDGRVEGLLVLNRMEARGRVSLWIMELAAVDQAARHALARTARWLAKEQQCDVLLSMATARLPGAVRLPPCFLPKKHVLMVRGGGPVEDGGPGLWDVQTGDWDTF